MRKIKNVLGTGCFFLCLGGWVYNGQLIAADQAEQAKEAALNAAAASAATPGAVNGGNSATPATGTPAGDATASATPAVGATVTETPATATPAAGATATDTPATATPADGGATLVQAGTTGATAELPTTRPAATEPANLKETSVSVGVDGVIQSFSASDLDINMALKLIAEKTQRNIVATKNVKGTVSVSLYNVTLSQMLDAILKPNGFDYVEKGNFIYVYTAEELANIQKAQRKPVSKVFRLKYVTAQDASVLLKPLMSSNGVAAITPVAGIGLPTGLNDTGGDQFATSDTLVINDYAENVAAIDNALKQIDVRPKQVLIESTILDATLSENNALGVDFVSLSGLNFSDIGSVISPLSGSATSSGGGNTTTATNVTTPGQVAGTLIPGNANHELDAGTNFASAVPTGGLSVGFLSNHISVFLRALETVSDVTVVANPKILALNKQHGEVHIGKKLGYQTTTTTQTATQQTVQFIDIGTKLVFRPFIGDDGYVRMEIHPEQSDGSIDAKGVPQTKNVEVTSNVMIKDGRTIVIGGLFSEQTTASRGQVPIIGNIPVLGVPFRQTADDTQRRETIVLLTPHIINDDTHIYEESELKAQDVNRMMLGNRAGLQPWGRDRIAQLWYTKAVEAQDAGKHDKALMYVDWALNTNPRFIEAIKLRETLTNKKVTEADESSIRSFVQDVLKSDAANTPDSGGPGHYPPEQAPTTAPGR